MFNETMYVPSNDYGGYHVALRVFKLHNHGNVEILPYGGYLDTCDFFLLIEIDDDHYKFPLQLKKTTVKERIEEGRRFLDFVNEDGPLKYQELIMILDKFVGFKQTAS